MSSSTPPLPSAQPEVYANLLADWLVAEGYTHCFFVAGGNIMHLLNALRTRLKCIPVVHEVAAGIAAEYLNEAPAEARAFALVTAGPGLTNIVTALAGAWLESRELLVIGGQVKSADLSRGDVRQRGIQEIDGVAIAESLCCTAVRLDTPVNQTTWRGFISAGTQGRPGPVFIEICLDVQGAPVDRAPLECPDQTPPAVPNPAEAAQSTAAPILSMLADAKRPVLLIGGGVSRAAAAAALPGLRRLGVPLMTTWNGCDRIGSEEPLWFGRPNTWGMRHSNLLLQQADLIIALGTRLGLQQTGFAWEEFVPVGTIVQVDIDPAESAKGHPRVDLAITGDANSILSSLASAPPWSGAEWVQFCTEVRDLVPLRDPANQTTTGYVCPYLFFDWLSELLDSEDLVIPCSSGGANSTAMQSLRQRSGQVVITNKGLASMGYGLAGAIGASLAFPERRTILIEGDGGFSQQLQELATVSVNQLPIKIFIFANDGYASIRSTQRNYFDGSYVGCDTSTGLGFPDWSTLFAAYGIPCSAVEPTTLSDIAFRSILHHPGPAAFIVRIDPEQTYYPRISSRVTASGSMVSEPLHRMSPELPPELAARVLRYL